MASHLLPLAIASVDPTLGRLDYDSLSDQALMEMFVSHLSEESTKKFKDGNGEFMDISEWPDVESHARDGQVLKLNWLGGISNVLSGELSFDFIPTKIQRIDIHSHPRLVGTVQTIHLPASLAHLGIFCTQMHGPFDMTKLPKNLQVCDIAENRFSGSCVLSALPSTLTLLDARRNKFSGSIDITKLPLGFESLSLSFNQLTGEVTFTDLPESLEYIFLHCNIFSGSVVIEKLPAKMKQLTLDSNAFEGSAVVPRNIARTFTHIRLGRNKLKAVVDETGKPHPREEKLLTTDRFNDIR